MASSTFEAAAGLAFHSRPPAGVSMPRAVSALARQSHWGMRFDPTSPT
jgi:hypothetical protein